MEEQISNIIHDHCYPIIVPKISFQSIDEKHLIHIQIYRGSNLLYYIESKEKMDGTYIRVGSTNRLANLEIIAELERQKRNISFDGELLFDQSVDHLDLTAFKTQYRDKTGEEWNDSVLRKLDLIKEYQGVWLPTIALILFSDSLIRKQFFPYAKVECARFKGRNSDKFINQKTIDVNLALQAEAAYEFVLRHINQGATVEGVYTSYHWEYSIKAIRELCGMQ